MYTPCIYYFQFLLVCICNSYTLYAVFIQFVFSILTVLYIQIKVCVDNYYSMLLQLIQFLFTVVIFILYLIQIAFTTHTICVYG